MEIANRKEKEDVVEEFIQFASDQRRRCELLPRSTIDEISFSSTSSSPSLTNYDVINVNPQKTHSSPNGRRGSVRKVK